MLNLFSVATFLHPFFLIFTQHILAIINQGANFKEARI